MKLGKLPPRIDSRTLNFTKYLTASLPDPPKQMDWTRGLKDWGWLGNDVLGDCTVAAVGHAVQLYTLNSWGEAIVTTPEVIGYYSKWCGYVPGDESTDRGGVELDVLNHWRKEGFAMAGHPSHKLLAYADVDPSHVQAVQQGVALFGSVYIGVALPRTAQGQDVWDGVPHAWNPASWFGSWGGHAVLVTGYDADYVRFISWGRVMAMTWQFWSHYVDEAHVLFHNGWYSTGLDLATLKADLEALS